MKLTPRRQKALKLIEWFIPDNCDWNNPATRLSSFGYFKLQDKYDDPEGIDPIEAFFLYSETGKLPDKIKDVARTVSLLWGQRCMAMQEKMWREGWHESTCFPQDFLNEPQYIKDFVFPKIFGLPKDWKPKTK